METLPSELLSAIFNILPPRTSLALVPRVCSRWRVVAESAEVGVSVEVRFVARIDAVGAGEEGEAKGRFQFFERKFQIETAAERWAVGARKAKSKLVVAHITIPITFPHPSDTTPTALLARIYRRTKATLGAPPDRTVRTVFTLVSGEGSVISACPPASLHTLAVAIKELSPLALDNDASFADILLASGCTDLPVSMLRHAQPSSPPDLSKSIHPLRLTPSVTAIHLRGAFAPSFLGAAIEADDVVAQRTNALVEFRYDPVSPRHHTLPYFCPLRLLNGTQRVLFENLKEFGTPWLHPLVGPDGSVYPGIKGTLRTFPSLKTCHFRVEVAENFAKGAPSMARYLAASFCGLREIKLYLQSGPVEIGDPHAPDAERMARGIAGFVKAFGGVERVVVVWESEGAEQAEGVVVARESRGDNARDTANEEAKGPDHVGAFLSVIKATLNKTAGIARVWCGRACDGAEVAAPWEVFGRVKWVGACAELCEI